MQLTKKFPLVSVVVLALISSNVVSGADSDTDLQNLVDEIQALATKSRKERAADRWLQNALEDLVEKYNFPWKDSLLSDDFSDGDFHKNPAWKVSSGEFWVDQRLGLRSEVVAQEITESAQPEQESSRPEEDIGRALIGALLQGALEDRKQQQQSGSQAGRPKMKTTPALIRTTVAIPRTFAVEAIFSQHNRPGTSGLLEWVVMQDAKAKNSYKLRLTSGKTSSLEILRIRNGKTSYLESVNITGINDGAEHTLSWRHSASGAISVFLDGTEVIQTSDRSFNNGFKFLALANRRGDFSVAGIEVLGGR